VRGGSWDFDASYCRTACRGGFAEGERLDNVGFRVVCVRRS
jgi:formylglycine-generating enzyme required for sulfatase activity